MDKKDALQKLQSLIYKCNELPNIAGRGPLKSRIKRRRDFLGQYKTNGSNIPRLMVKESQ